MIQQFLVIVITLIFSSVLNVHGNGRIEQQNIGIPNEINQPSESFSSSSQYITQQNIGIPNFSAIGESQSYGSSQKTDSIPQLNIDMITGSSRGEGGSVPLAVNSHQTIQYVDMPSTMTKNYQSTGIMSPNLISANQMIMSGQQSGYGTTGSSYITQKNIGSYGNSNRQVIRLPVHSRHTIEYVDVPSTGNIQPVNIEVPSTRLGANFNFRSSSNIKVSQSHQGSSGSYQETSSMDEPIRLSHTVRRPIIQELRETIQPYRKVVQQIQPVQQEIRTIIAVARKPSTSGSSKSNAGSYNHLGSSIPSMMMPANNGMYDGTMINPIVMHGTSNRYGTMVSNSQGYSKTKPSNGYAGSNPINVSTVNDINSSASSGGTQQQQQPQQSDRKGNRRFYDGSYGIGQQKI